MEREWFLGRISHVGVKVLDTFMQPFPLRHRSSAIAVAEGRARALCEVRRTPEIVSTPFHDDFTPRKGLYHRLRVLLVSTLTRQIRRRIR